jgi:hypothetical protein
VFSKSKKRKNHFLYSQESFTIEPGLLERVQRKVLGSRVTSGELGERRNQEVNI